jgi:hypothetical protein
MDGRRGMFATNRVAGPRTNVTSFLRAGEAKYVPSSILPREKGRKKKRSALLRALRNAPFPAQRGKVGMGANRCNEISKRGVI